MTTHELVEYDTLTEESQAMNTKKLINLNFDLTKAQKFCIIYI